MRRTRTAVAVVGALSLGACGDDGSGGLTGRGADAPSCEVFSLSDAEALLDADLADESYATDPGTVTCLYEGPGTRGGRVSWLVTTTAAPEAWAVAQELDDIEPIDDLGDAALLSRNEVHVVADGAYISAVVIRPGGFPRDAFDQAATLDLARTIVEAL